MMTGSEIDGSRGFKSSPLQQPVSYLRLSLYSCRTVQRILKKRYRNVLTSTISLGVK